MTIERGRIGIWRHLSGLTPDLVTEVEALGYGAIWADGAPDGESAGVGNLWATTDRSAAATGQRNLPDDPTTATRPRMPRSPHAIHLARPRPPPRSTAAPGGAWG